MKPVGPYSSQMFLPCLGVVSEQSVTRRRKGGGGVAREVAGGGCRCCRSRSRTLCRPAVRALALSGWPVGFYPSL